MPGGVNQLANPGLGAHPELNAAGSVGDLPRNRGEAPRANICKLKTKAHIKVAALNIRGIGNSDISHPDNKWVHINQLLRDEKIGILVVGEAHLNPRRLDEISRITESRMKILYSMREDTSNAAGVAIVLNKNRTNVQGVLMHEIVAGHAIQIETNWHGQERLTLLAIYAPNCSVTANADFWTRIREWYIRNPNRPRPDIMLGDCNVVEEAMDRLPMPLTDTACAAVDSLDELKAELQLMDGWRATYPQSRAFTYAQKRGGEVVHQSRLDRIYVKSHVFDHTFEWEIKTTGIRTDHRLVSVQFTCEEAPIVGHGRWSWPTHLTYDKELTRFIHEEGLLLQTKMEEAQRARLMGTTTHVDTPQSLWAVFKKRITAFSRKRAKIVVPKLQQKITDLERKIALVERVTEISEDERASQMGPLTEELTELVCRRHRATRATVKARNTLEGETISKYWSGLHKTRNSRDLIHRLRIPATDPTEQASYEKHSPRMAEMMRDYHAKVQIDEQEPNVEARTQAIVEVLNKVTVQTPEESQEALGARLSYEDVANALFLSANGKAPGLDGIPCI
ncbi:Endonuclease/exonuclease/phosphatase [Lentinula raphanica]|nr:Endonuclease/exonuclease/phosphatase [Lentinula raphanica]